MRLLLHECKKYVLRLLRQRPRKVKLILMYCIKFRKQRINAQPKTLDVTARMQECLAFGYVICLYRFNMFCWQTINY